MCGEQSGDCVARIVHGRSHGNSGCITAKVRRAEYVPRGVGTGGATGARAPLFCCPFVPYRPCLRERCRATSDRFYAHALRIYIHVHTHVASRAGGVAPRWRCAPTSEPRRPSLLVPRPFTKYKRTRINACARAGEGSLCACLSLHGPRNFINHLSRVVAVTPNSDEYHYAL